MPCRRCRCRSRSRPAGRTDKGSGYFISCSGGGLSGSARHPGVAAFPNGGQVHGPLRVLEYITPDPEFRYRHEDQLGSLIGMTGGKGAKRAEYVYLDYGRPIERVIAFDGDHGDCAPPRNVCQWN
jgi:hypothetical protein